MQYLAFSLRKNQKHTVLVKRKNNKLTEVAFLSLHPQDNYYYFLLDTR